MSSLLPLHRKRGRSLSPENSETSSLLFNVSASASVRASSSSSSSSSSSLTSFHLGDMGKFYYYVPDHDHDQEEGHRKRPLMKLTSSKLLLCSALALLGLCALLGVLSTSRRSTMATTTTTSSSSSCSIQDWKYPSCQKYLNSGITPPPFTDNKWDEFRTAYIQAVGEDRSSLATDDWRKPDDGSRSAFFISIEVRTSPGKGRGVFAAQDIPKGIKIWDNRHTARFPNECSVRTFLDILSDEDACNAIMWGYLNNYFSNDGNYEFILDLNDSVYMNEASTAEERNLEQRFVDENDVVGEDRVQQRRVPGAFAVYANQDIPAGTELLIDYSQVHRFGVSYWYEKMNFRSRGFWHYVTMH